MAYKKMKKSKTGYSMKDEYGPLIPQTKTHEPGRMSNKSYGDIITKCPTQKAPVPTKSMKPM